MKRGSHATIEKSAVTAVIVLVFICCFSHPAWALAPLNQSAPETTEVQPALTGPTAETPPPAMETKSFKKSSKQNILILHNDSESLPVSTETINKGPKKNLGQ